MDPVDILNNLLGEFGSSIGMPELELDEENRCNLMFDEVAVSFELSPDEASVYLYSYLGDVVSNDSKAAFAVLLDANCLFRGTMGATMGVDEAIVSVDKSVSPT